MAARHGDRFSKCLRSTAALSFALGIHNMDDVSAVVSVPIYSVRTSRPDLFNEMLRGFVLVHWDKDCRAIVVYIYNASPSLPPVPQA